MEQYTKEEIREKFWEEYVHAIMKGPDSHMYQKLHNVIPMTNVIDGSKKLIMKPSHLREKCGKFDHDEFLEESLRHLFHVRVDQAVHPGNQNSVVKNKQFVVVGKTQSGKSSVKGIVQSLCGLLKIPLIVITKGVKESIELHEKLVTLAEGTLMEKRRIMVASCDQDGCDTDIKEHLIYNALEGYHGGTLIIADTEAQVRKAINAVRRYRRNIPDGKFILVVDEADAMSRTEDREQVFEQALDELMDLNPSMTMKISATIFPVMLDILHSTRTGGRSDQIMSNDPKFFELEADEEYVGHEDIKPLTIDGKEVYLEDDEIKTDVRYGDIPYANRKVMNFYDDAMSDMNREKGILLMDCTCPYVNTSGNVREKAEAVQEHYAKQNKMLMVVTFAGAGPWMKPPYEPWNKRKEKSSIGDIIKYIDREYNLQMPIFIFGYTKMCRGISFRSDKRVPTHMLMSLGTGHNCSTVIQTLGRATFNGLSVLQKNGFDHVKCLTKEDDYTLSVHHPKYIKGVIERVRKGDSLAEAVACADKKFPSFADILAKTPREIGKMPGQGKQFQAQLDMKKNITKNPKSILGHRIAKNTFQTCPGEVFFGTVDSYNGKYWSILYDDGDDEDMNCKQVIKAIKLFNKLDKNILGKRKRSVWPLLDIEDIPEVNDMKSSTSKRGTILIQKEKRRRIYYAYEDDTPTMIAKKYDLDVHQILFYNRRRDGYDQIKTTSKFKVITPIVLPLEQIEMEI